MKIYFKDGLFHCNLKYMGFEMYFYGRNRVDVYKSALLRIGFSVIDGGIYK